MANRFDTIVIGLGAVGSAAVYQLAKKSSRVLGIDQFSPPHRQGSSHGDTRITRQAIGEGAELVPFALRSYEIWDEIEKATGRKVLTITGGLIMTSAEQSMRHGSNFFKQTIASAEQNNIPHHLLDANQIRKRFLQFKLQGNEKGYFEEKAGFLRPELCIEAQLELAQRHGAKIAVNEKVIRLTPAKDEVTITTSKGVYVGAKAVIASGSWVSDLIGERFKPLFRVFRQVLYWFEAAGSIRQFEMPNFPSGFGSLEQTPKT